MTIAARLCAGLVAMGLLGSSHGAFAQNDAPPVPKGMEGAIIHDPVFDLDAYEVFLPAKWHFQGTVVQGTTCFPVPFPVFRATSPDGLMMLERLPNLDWRWGTNPTISKSAGDCLAVQKAMSAQEMLRYVAGSMKVEYVRDEPLPAGQKEKAQQALEQSQAAMAGKYAMNHMQAPVQTVDMARAIVRFRNGSYTMKGLLYGTVNCSQSTTTNAVLRQSTWTTNTCEASIRYLHAPEAQFEAAVSLLDPSRVGSVELQRWTQAWSAASDRRTAANIGTIQRMGAQAMANTQAQGEQFRHSQEVRQKMSNDFNDTLKRGTQMSMNQTANAMNARSTASSNWVDYSLDQQTVRDPATGAVNKVSSSYNYTWIDSTGKTSFQTSDSSVNPNGSLPGVWNKQIVTNGDGTLK